VEGPFISGEDGPRGAHDPRHVRPPDWALLERWQRAADGRIRVLTLSPEYPGSADFIRRCAAAGIVVSIGHTAAAPEAVREAVAAGATMSTHLGNGAHLTIARHPNYIWEQLAADELMTSIIPDGFHLPDAVVKVMVRARGARIILVSDAVYLAGLPPGEYATHIGGKVVLTAEGKLCLAENPRILAGSAQMILHGVARLARLGIADLPDGWEMASTRPAAFLGLAAGKGLRAGAPADFVVFDWEGEGIAVRQTWKGGRKVYERGD
jgi:N-acetylglucosamine-6-phosphate deacetylase